MRTFTKEGKREGEKENKRVLTSIEGPAKMNCVFPLEVTAFLKAELSQGFISSLRWIKAADSSPKFCIIRRERIKGPNGRRKKKGELDYL